MLEAATKIQVLIVDDEAPARLRLKDALLVNHDVAKIAEAANAEEAIILLKTDGPDLMLLDVQMPGMNGFEMIERLGTERMPVTIFVTAFDQHAIRAFEANALDYLLKPFSDDRLNAAIARAKQRVDDLRLRDFRENLARTLSGIAKPSEYHDRLAIKADGVVQLLPARQIDWIEAAGPYVSLHIGAKQILHRESLSSLLTRLHPRQFVRVHRSVIVNIESIVHLEPLSHGEYEVLTKGGERFRVSRTYRTVLEARLGQTLS